jgi:hypothetical protein
VINKSKTQNQNNNKDYGKFYKRVKELRMEYPSKGINYKMKQEDDEWKEMK